MTSLRILSAQDIDRIISDIDPKLIIESQRSAFGEASRPCDATPADVQVPARTLTYAPNATTLYMPARAKASGGTAIKIVSIVPSGVYSSNVVIDEKSGQVVAVMNSTQLTPLRNAGGTALFLELCPPPTAPRRIALFGAGAQILTHTRLLLKLYPSIQHIALVVYQRDARSEEFTAVLTRDFPHVQLESGVSKSPSNPPIDGFDVSALVNQADILISATPSRSPLFNGKDVKQGARAIHVGAYTPEMRETDDAHIERAGIVVVDSIYMALKEAGDLIQCGKKAEDMVELGALVNDPEMRKRAGQGGDIVIFKSVGLGSQDVGVSDLILRQAEEKDIGTVIPNFA